MAGKPTKWTDDHWCRNAKSGDGSFSDDFSLTLTTATPRGTRGAVQSQKSAELGLP
jgi:hypothetical protein